MSTLYHPVFLSKSIIALILGLFISHVGVGQTYEKSILDHREHYKNEFIKDKDAPIKKKDIKHLRFFDPDSKYQVSASFSRTTDATPFEMLTSSGKTRSYVAYGILEFEIAGKTQNLTIYRSLDLQKIPKYRHYAFVPFKDLTNGKLSYGGGRYLDLQTTDIENGHLVLDFNKAYNPYCAYSAGYSCPIPPEANHLQVEINAGEQNFSK